MQEITLADNADYLVILIDDRDRADAALSLATAGTVAFSSTEITSLVMTSIACIGSPRTVWVSNRVQRCPLPHRPRSIGAGRERIAV